MKKVRLMLCMMVAVALGVSAQSYDEKIANAMNSHDWFALDSIYKTAPHDSIHEFLEIFSRCLLGNRLNRPDVSIPAFQELLNTQSLDVGNLVSSAYMFGMDLSRVGKNEAAASMINSILSASAQYLDSMTIVGLTSTANRYAALAAYKPYQIDFDGADVGSVPFAIVPVGPKDKASVLIHLQDSYINGESADITFDTGAGVNLISHEMAERFKLTPLENTRITVSGINNRDGYVAVAGELKIGNMTVRDVPFTVVSLSSDNEEADKYIDSFNIVVGSELMLQLKDVTIDFANRKITVPASVPGRSGIAPDLCFSPTMNLLAKGTVLSTPMMMCIDSGDASFGTLSNSFFETHKDYITSHAEPDTIREAGIGGTIYSECYKVPDMPVALGGNVVSPPELVVKTGDNSMRADYDCIIGVKTLMMFGKVRFNLVDFVMSTELSATTMVAPHYTVPTFSYPKGKGLNLLQAIGVIGVGIGRGLINPNAPAHPDL
ncbi:MAG: retroviral-like aspartic protease family protein [Staphylococcus sp.]|nr:retroviral-like aspartic protease family protein [Staphylococcus sp.]